MTTTLTTPAPELGWVEVPPEVVERVAAYRFERDCALNGASYKWVEQNEITQGRWESQARKDLEDIWPALRVDQGVGVLG